MRGAWTLGLISALLMGSLPAQAGLLGKLIPVIRRPYTVEAVRVDGLYDTQDPVVVVDTYEVWGAGTFEGEYTERYLRAEVDKRDGRATVRLMERRRSRTMHDPGRGMGRSGVGMRELRTGRTWIDRECEIVYDETQDKVVEVCHDIHDLWIVLDGATMRWAIQRDLLETVVWMAKGQPSAEWELPGEEVRVLLERVAQVQAELGY